MDPDSNAQETTKKAEQRALELLSLHTWDRAYLSEAVALCKDNEERYWAPKLQTRIDAFWWGQTHCYQDQCENVPFSSIGGLHVRDEPVVPRYIPRHQTADWLAGYLDRAEEIYGPDWKTCKFEWRPVLTIP